MQRWQWPIYNGTIEKFCLIKYEVRRTTVFYTFLSVLRCHWYSCKSGIVIFAWRVTSNNAYSPFNSSFYLLVTYILTLRSFAHSLIYLLTHLLTYLLTPLRIYSITPYLRNYSLLIVGGII